MAKYKLVVNQGYFLDNYLLYSKGSGTKAVRLLTHKEMYQSHITMTELAIPDPA